MTLPYMSKDFIRCREIGRRNKRLVELELGWRFAAKTGDRDKMLEIEAKIAEIKRHLQEGT